MARNDSAVLEQPPKESPPARVPVDTLFFSRSPSPTIYWDQLWREQRQNTEGRTVNVPVTGKRTIMFSNHRCLIGKAHADIAESLKRFRVGLEDGYEQAYISAVDLGKWREGSRAAQARYDSFLSGMHTRSDIGRPDRKLVDREISAEIDEAVQRELGLSVEQFRVAVKTGKV